MQSLIIGITSNRNVKQRNLESLCEYGLPPSYADYTDELGKDRILYAADAMCDFFPCCTKDANDGLILHIDHDAARKALLDRYAHARDLFDLMAHGETRLAVRYEASILASGDRYGFHILVDNLRDMDDMNDLEFMRYCADQDLAPDTLYIKRAWDYYW